MAGEIQLNSVSLATESSGTVTLNSSTDIKGCLNASGSAPIYACRAWVNFNGTGTVAIRDSGNVSSITDLGATAKYAINFLTAMPDTNYSWVASAGFDNVAQQLWVSSPSSVALATWKTTTQIQLQGVYANNTANADPQEFNVTIFR